MNSHQLLMTFCEVSHC